MKKLLCMLLCLMLVAPAVTAETADTLQKLLVRQLTAGYGLRGNVKVTASGVAEWLEYVLPFTATEIQIRAIGQKQGGASAYVQDDDEWQARFYVKDNNGNETANSWLYGDPEGIYFQSELLPDTILSYPVKDVHLLYQLIRGDMQDLLFAFDPLKLTETGANGVPSSYHAIAEIIGVSQEDWAQNWLPVLEKYFVYLDLWLTGYGDPAYMTGTSAGSGTLSTSYIIPADELKEQAKHLIGQMLYDSALQELVSPLLTLDERVMYFNPSLVYVYEACIDALQLEGDIILSRELSARGETVGAMISLPLPELPEKVTAPVGALASAIFGLPYNDIMTGMKRIEIKQELDQRSLVITGDRCAITFEAVQNSNDAESVALNGTMRIQPAGETMGATAEFSLSCSHIIWEDEKYITHDTSAFSIAFTSKASELVSTDPLYGRCIDFSPFSFDVTLDFRNNTYQSESPAQVNLSIAAQLPDGKISADAVLRITTQMSMQELSSVGAQPVNALTAEEKEALTASFLQNAVVTMANLHSPSQPVDTNQTQEVPTVTE